MPKANPSRTSGKKAARPTRRRTQSPVSSTPSAPDVSGQVPPEWFQSMISAVIPAVTEGVMASLRQMGVVPGSSDSITPASSDSHQLPDVGIPGPDAGPSDVGTLVASRAKPVDLGVDTKIKGKIWADQFVDMGSLLSSREGGNIQLSEGSDGSFSFKKVASAAPVKTMAQWFRAFHIFVAVYTSRYPAAAPKLMKYADTMQKLSHQAGDQSALYYDRQFRQWRQDDPSMLPWDHVNTELYSAALASGLCQKVQTRPLFRASASTPTAHTRKGICFMYNNNGRCSRTSCPFSHICSVCRGSHAKKSCNIRAGQAVPAGIERSPSSGQAKFPGRK